MVKDLFRLSSFESESIFARGRMESRLGLPFLGQGYLDARGSASISKSLSFLEILLDRRVSGQCEGELRLLGDVRLPSGLNGRAIAAGHDGRMESRCLLPAPHHSFPVHQLLLVIQKGHTLSEGR